MPESEFQESSIKLHEGTLFVKIWGQHLLENSPPLILFHDSLGCVDTWKDFPAQLFKKIQHPVIAYDRWGFGKSSPRHERPSIHFITEEAEIFFPQILEKLQIKKFILFGHSVGGAMALACASKFPQRCQGVISESAQAFVEERTKKGILKAQEDFKDLQKFSRLEKYHGEKTSWVLDAWTGVWLSEAFSTWSLEPHLRLVTCPVLAIHGDQDEYGSLAFPEAIKTFSQGPSEMHIIKNGGHIPHRENPNHIVELVNNFISRLL